ncbi:hypothetical protein NCCP2716_06570 [Sporosarcina sp. NCCP-2716]|uniref:hypothetical protein n=1 Tax=Sporosarcina sp. NCCP-2716 TaxID=2943679 RepID=UPI002041EF02|nr:hypothetical protein [Sporosarcina sp. NCCP-2716]GKV68159.1 hypothetical protein NCCP2716_06570 [Sporosarcina sp. NCCP-2716]
MHENSLQTSDNGQLPSTVSEEVRMLRVQVKEMEEEISELKKDLHAIDLLQKKPIISSDSLAIGGFWIVAALTIIGIFY